MDGEEGAAGPACGLILPAHAASKGGDHLDDSQMDEEASLNAIASQPISAYTDPEEVDLFVDFLPMLCATPIAICRRRVLKQAVKSLGFSMVETTTYNDGSNDYLTTVRIDVPSRIRVARLRTRLFYGEWSLTAHEAIQSACSNALDYLRKVQVLTIDGIHSTALRQCQKELLRAKSWTKAFEQRVKEMESSLTVVPKDNAQVVDISHTSTTPTLLDESNDTVECAPEEQSTPSRHAGLDLVAPTDVVKVPQQEINEDRNSIPLPNITMMTFFQDTLHGVPFLSLEDMDPLFPRQRRFRRDKYRPVPIPHPDPALAAFNRGKRKLIIQLQRSQVAAPSLPHVSLLDHIDSENIIADDMGGQFSHVRQDHNDPKRIVPPLTPLPPGTELMTARTRSVQLNSQVRKCMFNDDTKRGTGFDDAVMARTTDFAEINEVTGDVLCVGQSNPSPTEVLPDENSQSPHVQNTVDKCVSRPAC